MPHNNKVNFKGTAFGLIFCAVIVAFLNLYMNIVATYGKSNLQLDLSADGDVIAFHQFESLHNHGAVGHQRGHSATLHPNAKHTGLIGENTLQQVDYVKSLIRERTKLLRPQTFAVEPPSTFGRFLPSKLLSNFNFASYWRDLKKAIRPRRILNQHFNFTHLVQVAQMTKIVNAKLQNKTFEVEVLMEGEQNAIWIPRAPGLRFRQEIGSFHLASLLNMHNVWPVVGRKVNLLNELKNSADVEFKSKFHVSDDGRLCFHLKYKNSSICAHADNYLEGALVISLDSNSYPLKTISHPWSDSEWLKDNRFCQSVLQQDFFGQLHVFGDLVDIAIFDYLVNKVNRTDLHYFDRIEPKMLVMIDNGASFGGVDGSHDETAILAPLFQCCKIRKRLYQLLLRFSELNLGDMLNERLKDDPLYSTPILDTNQLSALNRRLRKVLAVVGSCLEEYSAENVFIVDRV